MWLLDYLWIYLLCYTLVKVLLDWIYILNPANCIIWITKKEKTLLVLDVQI